MYRIGMGWILMTAMILTACGITSTNEGEVEAPMEEKAFPDLEERLEDRGPAPEIENEVWLNSQDPLRLDTLKGNVILLDFWTFG
jgi:hypothetical protein